MSSQGIAGVFKDLEALESGPAREVSPVGKAAFGVITPVCKEEECLGAGPR